MWFLVFCIQILAKVPNKRRNKNYLNNGNVLGWGSSLVSSACKVQLPCSVQNWHTISYLSVGYVCESTFYKTTKIIIINCFAVRKKMTNSESIVRWWCNTLCENLTSVICLHIECCFLKWFYFNRSDLVLTLLCELKSTWEPWFQTDWK